MRLPMRNEGTNLLSASDKKRAAQHLQNGYAGVEAAQRAVNTYRSNKALKTSSGRAKGRS
jgi:hypothetical protein